MRQSSNSLEAYVDHLTELCTIAGVGMRLAASTNQDAGAGEYGTLCPDLQVDPEGQSLFNTFSQVGRMQILHLGRTWLTAAKDRIRASVLANKCLELLAMRNTHSKAVSEIATLHRKIAAATKDSSIAPTRGKNSLHTRTVIYTRSDDRRRCDAT